ncbi:MAG TPA: hypothetical protein VHY82_01460 [Acetobacteraceae bacterium]|nr:hypothetical protein [Acetobacteraceae bacterium]
MMRLFAAVLLLASVAAPAFACELNSASNSNNTSQTASGSHQATSQSRS